ncbi:MAG TPA: ribosome biogenesis GTPase Der [Gemmatimonadales bacterium]
MSEPTVAIVGRPNVGKSTLFNRLLGGRDAIVSEQAGTTRDRHFGATEWGGRRFWLVDTGGLVPRSSDSMDVAVREQVDLAVNESQLIVFVVDGREGLNPVDREIGTRLRRAGRPVIVAVNKLDDLPDTTAHLAFHALGLGDPMPVSAVTGKASGDLLDQIVALLPAAAQPGDTETIQVAVVGRPNAGKSSLLNRLLGEPRLVVSPQPGTTRDAIDTPLRYRGKTLNFIDTAGLRRRSKVEDDIEFYAALRTHRAIERADVCVLVVDAERGMHTQDLRIASEAWERGAGLIIAVTKWDLVPDKDGNTAKRGQDLLVRKAPFLGFIPFVYVSALTGQRVSKLPDLILEVAEARQRRVQTAEVNRVLQELVARNAPPQEQGAEVKLLFASQIGIRPPSIAIVTNRPEDIAESYQRYLQNGFRSAWGFMGSPLRLKFTARGTSRLDRKDDGRRPRRG